MVGYQAVRQYVSSAANNVSDKAHGLVDRLHGLQQYAKGAAAAGVALSPVALYALGCSETPTEQVNRDPNCPGKQECPPPTPQKRDTVYRDTGSTKTVTKTDSLYFVLPKTPAHKEMADTSAIAICEDISFAVRYVPNSISGITNIRFAEITDDFCGIYGTKEGGVIGAIRKWIVPDDGISGDPAAVQALRERISNDKVIAKVWLERDGQPGSIIFGLPTTAKRVKLILGETYDGKGGLDYLFGNGQAVLEAKAYGQTVSTATSREHYVNIVNPRRMPYRMEVEKKEKVGPLEKVTKAQIDSLMKLSGSGSANYNGSSLNNAQYDGNGGSAQNSTPWPSKKQSRNNNKQHRQSANPATSQTRKQMARR